MKKLAVILPFALLVLTGCGGNEPAEPTTTPSPSASQEVPAEAEETYAECVAGIPMDPDEVQAYIDEVEAECGGLE